MTVRKGKSRFKVGQRVSVCVPGTIEEIKREIGRSLDALNQESPTKLTLKQWKEIAEGAAQPEPRGSEAHFKSLWKESERLATYFGRDEINSKHWRQCVAEFYSVLCRVAAATAARTNLATERPVAETVAIGAGDSYAGNQSHQETGPISLAWKRGWQAAIEAAAQKLEVHDVPHAVKAWTNYFAAAIRSLRPSPAPPEPK